MILLEEIVRAILALVQGSMSPGGLSAALDAQAKLSTEHLDWRNSIVDLMKLVGIDSSLENRKMMARELGYTGPINGSGDMNNFLHARVMEKLGRT